MQGLHLQIPACQSRCYPAGSNIAEVNCTCGPLRAAISFNSVSGKKCYTPYLVQPGRQDFHCTEVQVGILDHRKPRLAAHLVSCLAGRTPACNRCCKTPSPCRNTREYGFSARRECTHFEFHATNYDRVERSRETETVKFRLLEFSTTLNNGMDSSSPQRHLKCQTVDDESSQR